MDFDLAIVKAYRDFEIPAADIALYPGPARAFCNVVISFHGAPVASEVIIDRLLVLDQRGELPGIAVLR